MTAQSYCSWMEELCLSVVKESVLGKCVRTNYLNYPATKFGILTPADLEFPISNVGAYHNCHFAHCTSKEMLIGGKDASHRYMQRMTVQSTNRCGDHNQMVVCYMP